MASPSIPILLFPQGSEIVVAKLIEIKWKESLLFSGEATLYFEIAFKYDYNIFADNDEWISIARVSSDSFTYQWIIPEFLFGAKISIGIRSVSVNGNYSEYSQSGVFSISQKTLPKPSISSPVVNKKYGSQIDIIISNKFNEEDFKKLNRYRLNLYYSSESSGVSLAPIYEKISGATSKVVWDVSNVTPGEDYVLYAYYTDDFGNKGPQISIGPFSIENQGYFIIDTDGPEVAVKINSINGYIKERNVSVELFTSDLVSDIHSFYIEQKKVKKQTDGTFYYDTPVRTEAKTYQKNNFIRIGPLVNPGDPREEEGRYIVAALVQDIAGNRSDESGESIVKKRNKMRKLYEKTGYKFTSWVKNEDIIYASMYNGSETEVIKVSYGVVSVVSKFADVIVAMGFKNNKLYGSRLNSKKSFDLVYIEQRGLVDVAQIDAADTQISAIGNAGDGGVLVGCLDGRIYQILNEESVFIGNIDSPVFAIDTIDTFRSIILGQTSEKVFVYANGKITKANVTI